MSYITTKKLDTWQKELHESPSFTDVLELLSLDISNPPFLLDYIPRFPQKVPLDFVERMQPNNWFDPLLLQVLPQTEENNKKKMFIKDPVMDQRFEIFSGVIHKYSSRILVMPTINCAIHCRYCFRKHFPYDKISPLLSNNAFWKYLIEYNQIEEVILSGGDPLMLNDSIILKWIEKINTIPHIKRIRIHSRLPIVLPSRILKSQLLEKLKPYSKKIIFVIHCNHPQELQNECVLALQELRKFCFVLNQSVLLKGINDSVDTLKKLYTKLFECGTLPYYLHQVDQVSGVHHFEVSPKKGKVLHTALLKQLPGYLVPRYVKDEEPFDFKKQY